jgi:glycosyltransferase involved in cell wall biosynthesis
MTVCLFGSYTTAEGYPVNRVLRQGLRQAGVTVIECRAEVWGRFVHELFERATPGRLLRTAARMIWGVLSLTVKYARAPAHDWVLIGYPGYIDVLLARLLIRRRRKIVLISFISLFDTAIGDRRAASEGSWSARLLRWLDAAAFRCADVVLVDTDEHGDHYAQLFGIDRDRFVRSFVGEDDEQFRPLQAPIRKDGEPLQVLFFGTYVPLHGIDTIVDAAAELQHEEIDFTLIGSGDQLDSLQVRSQQLGGRVRFVKQWQSTTQLCEHIGRADICLGVFGTTPKAARVIPYKVFDALAVGRPVVTRDSPAIREMLRDGESALLCPAGDGKALAEAIRRLHADPRLTERIAAAGHQAFLAHGTPAAIGQRLLQQVEIPA